MMLIGEAPGEHEEREGQPFIGRSGQLLRRLLSDAGIDFSLCYVTNLVKYRPPLNRTPYIFEIQASRPCLLAEVDIVRPILIITLGLTSLIAMTGQPNAYWGHTERRGHTESWYHPNGFTCGLLPLYHPAYLLRSGPDVQEETLAALRRTMKPL
jgi:DNA polymerase